MAVCPECGADEVACESRFNEFLVMEFSDPGYGAVHHLTVATYMLQHSSKLTREGWLQMRALLKEFLLEKKPPEFIRNENRDLVDSGKRKFKFKSKNDQPVIPKTTWTRTILDVPADDSASYCKGINEWAISALSDAQELVI
jgi:hypothetical protein